MFSMFFLYDEAHKMSSFDTQEVGKYFSGILGHKKITKWEIGTCDGLYRKQQGLYNGPSRSQKVL